MIIVETITINDKFFNKTYSSNGFYILRDGIVYSDAIDPVEFNRTYVETNVLIDNNSDYSAILPLQSIQQWSQPNEQNTYSVNNKVIHNGLIWISLIDNNTWQPGEFGWEVL